MILSLLFEGRKKREAREISSQCEVHHNSYQYSVKWSCSDRDNEVADVKPGLISYHAPLPGECLPAGSHKGMESFAPRKKIGPSSARTQDL